MIALVRARRFHLSAAQMILLTMCAFFALVSLAVLAGYLSAARQRDALAVQVQTVERAVQRLQARGVTAGSLGGSLQPGENPFPREMPTADLTSIVVQSAQQSGVRIESMTPQLGSGERLAQGSYRTYKLALRVNGSPVQVSDFIGRIERGSVRSWVIDNIQAKPLPASVWDISFDVTAYAQPAAG